jgi:hypothetical protein
MFRNFAGGPAPVENLVIVSQRGLGLAPVQGRKFIRGSGENLFEPSLGVASPASGSNGFSPYRNRARPPELAQNINS